MELPGLDADLQRKLAVEISRPGCRSCAKSKTIRKYKKIQDARNASPQNNLDKKRNHR